MKKRTTGIIAILLLSIILTYCKKESVNTVPLLASFSLEKDGSIDQFKYEYDSEGRLVNISGPSEEESYSYQNEKITYRAFNNDGTLKEQNDYYFTNKMLDSIINTNPYNPLHGKKFYEYKENQYIKQFRIFYDGPDQFLAIFKYTIENGNLTVIDGMYIDVKYSDTSYNKIYLEYDSKGNMIKYSDDDRTLAEYEYTDISNPLQQTTDYYITKRPYEIDIIHGPKRMFHYSKYLISKETFFYGTSSSIEYIHDYQLDESGKPIGGTITLGDLVKNIEFRYK